MSRDLPDKTDFMKNIPLRIATIPKVENRVVSTTRLCFLNSKMVLVITTDETAPKSLNSIFIYHSGDLLKSIFSQWHQNQDGITEEFINYRVEQDLAWCRLPEWLKFQRY